MALDLREWLTPQVLEYLYQQYSDAGRVYPEGGQSPYFTVGFDSLGTEERFIICWRAIYDEDTEGYYYDCDGLTTTTGVCNKSTPITAIAKEYHYYLDTYSEGQITDATIRYGNLQHTYFYGALKSGDTIEFLYMDWLSLTKYSLYLPETTIELQRPSFATGCDEYGQCSGLFARVYYLSSIKGYLKGIKMTDFQSPSSFQFPEITSDMQVRLYCMDSDCFNPAPYTLPPFSVSDWCFHYCASNEAASGAITQREQLIEKLLPQKLYVAPTISGESNNIVIRIPEFQATIYGGNPIPPDLFEEVINNEDGFSYFPICYTDYCRACASDVSFAALQYPDAGGTTMLRMSFYFIPKTQYASLVWDDYYVIWDEGEDPPLIIRILDYLQNNPPLWEGDTNELPSPSSDDDLLIPPDWEDIYPDLPDDDDEYPPDIYPLPTPPEDLPPVENPPQPQPPPDIPPDTPPEPIPPEEPPEEEPPEPPTPMPISDIPTVIVEPVYTIAMPTPFRWEDIAGVFCEEIPTNLVRSFRNYDYDTDDNIVRYTISMDIYVPYSSDLTIWTGKSITNINYTKEILTTIPSEEYIWSTTINMTQDDENNRYIASVTGTVAFWDDEIGYAQPTYLVYLGYGNISLTRDVSELRLMKLGNSTTISKEAIARVAKPSFTTAYIAFLDGATIKRIATSKQNTKFMRFLWMVSNSFNIGISLWSLCRVYAPYLLDFANNIDKLQKWGI